MSFYTLFIISGCKGTNKKWANQVVNPIFIQITMLAILAVSLTNSRYTDEASREDDIAQYRIASDQGQW
jgi:hypothetical protein